MTVPPQLTLNGRETRPQAPQESPVPMTDQQLAAARLQVIDALAERLVATHEALGRIVSLAQSVDMKDADALSEIVDIAEASLRPSA